MHTVEAPDTRVTKVWHPDGPEHFHGVYGGAPVEKGEPAYQLHTGEIITL